MGIRLDKKKTPLTLHLRITVNILLQIHCTEVTSHDSTCDYKTGFSISASFLKFITNYLCYRLLIINWQIVLLDGCMVEFETESDDEDITDVDKKPNEKGDFENINNEKEGSKSEDFSAGDIFLWLT